MNKDIFTKNGNYPFDDIMSYIILISIIVMIFLNKDIPNFLTYWGYASIGWLYGIKNYFKKVKGD